MNRHLQSIFDEAIAERAFPGGQVWLSRGDEIVVHEAFGTTAYEDDGSSPVDGGSLHDIASVTELFTASAFWIVARGGSGVHRGH